MTSTAPGPAVPVQQVPTVRLGADNSTVLKQLGLLSELAGEWQGSGFNLIARPDFHDGANTYLQLNQTRETLTITPIGAAIPNRGFGQDDINLFGLNYLQRIEDAATGGALHFEPGLWMTQPTTTYPAQSAPPGGQLIFRLGSIPHGNSLLAQGVASTFTGPPAISAAGAEYAFSAFPSFNTTPYPVPPTSTTTPPVILNAAGSSEKLTAPLFGRPTFDEYDVSVPSGPGNPRTPFETSPPDPPLPESIDGVPMQDVVNDPALLLQAVIKQQTAGGATFSGVALNVQSLTSVTFYQKPNSADQNAITTVSVTNAGGDVGNIPFLEGGSPVGTQGSNAQIAQVYATFWIEKVTPAQGVPFMQLQYAQFTALDFEIFTELGSSTVMNLGWPHVSVATLRKTFL